MSEIARVMLPSGELIWVRVQAAGPAATGERAAGPADVGLKDRIAPTADALRLPEFAETVRGVVTSVRRPSTSTGAIRSLWNSALRLPRGRTAARVGGLLSVLAEVGGTAQARVRASWDRHDAASVPLGHEESEPE
jgi:hypothetical protein